MNYSKLSVAAMLAVAAMSSCTNDSELNSAKSEYVNTVRVSVEDFQPEAPSTRTAYTVDAAGFHFQWTSGDALGIYPVGGDQVKFPISAGDGAATATFDGGAWKLRSEFQYAAYCPFSTANYTISQTALPVSFTGQTQNGNGSAAHLGKYDYLACAATSPDGSGGVNLTMKHLGAFLRLQLTMPKADTFSSVVLESDGTEFVIAGTFDLTAATPAITPTSTSSTYSIDLTNVSTTEKNQVITVYAIVAPANLSTSNIKVTVKGTGKTTYVQTVAGKNFVERSAYNIVVDNFPSGTNANGENIDWKEDSTTGIENGHQWVDLGLSVKWATCNIGASSPEEYGDYYAWGEVEPKETYEWSTYKLCNKSKDLIYKYFSSGYRADNKTVLDPEDDAATYNWRGNWRMPTYNEFFEMYTNCYWVWTESYNDSDIKGYIVYKIKSDSDKGKHIKANETPSDSYTLYDQHIFLPAAGYIDYSQTFRAGYIDYYWTSTTTLYAGQDQYAIACSGGGYPSNNARYAGCQIRPVFQ